MADISDIITHLFDFKITFIKNTGFDKVPGSCNFFHFSHTHIALKHAFMGFLYAIGANLPSVIL
jgi:hypothetical protein